MDVQQIKLIRNAIKSNDLALLHSLLDAHPEALSWMTTFGTWLHVAASSGRVEMVRLLVETFGVDVNLRGGVADSSALHRAASDGHYDVVRYLLDHGAQMDTSEPERNPLFGAIMSGNLDIGKLLIERGIDTQVRYSGDRMKEMSARDFAKERGESEFVDFLTGLREN